MKKLILAVIFLFQVVSSFSQDYIILKNGKRIDGKVTIENLQYYDFHQPKIVCNGKAYRGGPVASFQCDGIYYANIMKKLFTPSIIRGKINVFYFTVINSRGGIAVYTHQDYGIQKNEKDEVIKLTYRHLKKMISDNPSLVKELEELGKPKAKITMNETVANKLLMSYDAKLLEIINKYNAN
ncbi:MAG TPA: hypothetical protein PLU17_10740 [Chitinophagaceae bacterium]|nr:hypothetical protein [Chitinophagaceae bacterium]